MVVLPEKVKPVRSRVLGDWPYLACLSAALTWLIVACRAAGRPGCPLISKGAARADYHARANCIVAEPFDDNEGSCFSVTGIGVEGHRACQGDFAATDFVHL